VTFLNGRLTSIIALGTVLGCALSGCGSGSSEGSSTTSSTTPNSTSDSSTGGAKRPSPTAPTVTASGDTIKIGLIGSLSGDQKPWGEDSRDGAQIAVDEFNAAGGLNGKKVTMDVGDSASAPEPAKTAAEKLLSDGVIGIVGEVSSGNTIQIAKSAFEKNVPVVAIGATKTELADIGTNVFRVCYTDDFQGPVMANFAYSKLNLRNVAVMTDNKLPYSQGLSKSFSDTFTKLGGKIVDEAFYETGNSQFNGQLTEIQAKNPDGIFISGYFPEVGPIAQQARQAGITKAVLMGGDGWDSPQLLVSGGDAILGGFFCNHYNNADNRPQVAEFQKKWKAKFGKLPGTTMAALGYDAMALTLDALKRAKGADSASLRDAIDDTTGFKGVSGDITLKGQNGNPPKRAIVVEVTKKDANDQWQKFAKDYTPDQITK
jgi:branched-chain amino acid transport system substrate-binding protein